MAEKLTVAFGGCKVPDFGERDTSQWAHAQYTEIKTLWIDAHA